MAAKRHYWTRDQLDKMVEMAEMGVRRAEIARMFEASVGAVDWQLLRLGVVGPRGRYLAAPKSVEYLRAGKVVRRFTAEEDANLLQLEASGLSASQIGRMIGRAHHTIIGRLAALARREQIDEIR